MLDGTLDNRHNRTSNIKIQLNLIKQDPIGPDFDEQSFWGLKSPVPSSLSPPCIAVMD